MVGGTGREGLPGPTTYHRGVEPSPAPPPGTDPDSQLPSVLARVLAFVSILVGGGAGGLIGYAFAELGGFEGPSVGLLTVAAALLGAGGVAVVAVLTLRAFGEWETIRRTGSRRTTATDGPIRSRR